MVRTVGVSGVSGQKQYKKTYHKFRGVDFSSNGSQVEDNRSPDALNMIADIGGFPVKRAGWRVLRQFPGRINGIFLHVPGYYVIHSGTELYYWGGNNATRIYAGVYDQRSTAFKFGDYLFILTGLEYLYFDGVNIKSVLSNAFVPTTTIAADPDGSGGSSYQDENYLTYKRKNTFVSNGTTRVYHLDKKYLLSVDQVLVNSVAVTSYTTDLINGLVTFTTAPAASATVGVPNVEITFSRLTDRAAIINCTIAVIYSNRIFFSGNYLRQNVDFVSALNDPFYVPVNSYTDVGNDASAIMGYLRMGDSLAIVKEDNLQDATLFLRTAELGSGELIFPVKQGIAGTGAISKHCFFNLVDDPLYLSRSGVYAVATQLVTAEKTLQSRSSRVNARLTKEDLSEAVAAQWEGFYIVCAGGRAYLADSRQKTYYNNSTQSYEYEWYFWDNIPARVLFEDKSQLYFGTEDGRICCFNGDLLDDEKEPSCEAYNDDGAPIVAYWSTPKSDDDSFMTYKTLLKRGCGIYLKNYADSSVKISIVTDKDFGRLIRRVNASIFDFNKVDFDDFTFNTLPQNVVAFNARVKKYKTVQVVVMNDQLNQGFGIYAIERKFTYGSQVK